MVALGSVATVTSKSMVNIPVAVRRKLGLKQGSKVEFVDVEEGVLLVPLKSLRELRGAASGPGAERLRKAIAELEQERRREAQNE